MNRKALLSMLFLAMLVVGMSVHVTPVKSAVSGTVTIVLPNYVVPGGAIWVWIEDFDATGGYTYFYLSTDADPAISSGDIRIAKEKTSDVEEYMTEEEGLTLTIPSNIDPGKYYLKVTDKSGVGADAIVSKEYPDLDGIIDGLPAGWSGLEQVEVLEEKDWPTITIDPTSGEVGDEFDVKGEDISSDYVEATLFWDSYSWTKDALANYEGMMVTESVEDNEFEAEDVEVPEAFMGTHSVLVLLWNEEDEEYLGASVDFEVNPSIEVTPLDAEFSIEAEELSQQVELKAHGFPEGTLDEDTIRFIVRDIRTGEQIDTISTEHESVDIADKPNPPGTFEGEVLTVTADEVPEGIIDIRFEVNGEAFTLENELLSSTPSDPGKQKGMLSVTSGEIGDEVTFYVINLPANVAVDVIFEDETSKSLLDLGEPLPSADAFGAFKYTFELKDLPSDTYSVRIRDVDHDRTRSIGTFEVLTTIKFYDYYTDEEVDSATVGDRLYILGKAFPIDAELDTLVIGGEKIEFDETVTIGSNGEFDSRDAFDDEYFEVPHVSGGGKEVSVEIEGEDASGKKITLSSEITIDPKIEAIDEEEETGVLALNENGEWKDAFSVDLFGGQIMKITGVGFLAGESVTVTFISDDKDIEAKCEILDGGKADSSGDLEIVFMLPHGRDFAKSTITDGDIKVAGATKTNKDSTYDRFDDYLTVSRPDDDYAIIYFNLQSDGTLELEDVHVGDSIRVVGIGFDTEDLTLEIDGEEVRSVTAKYGYFDTMVTIPELERASPEDGYVLKETSTGRESAMFGIKSKVTLSTYRAAPGTEITVKGTGWVEDQDVDIIWENLPKLATGEPDEDGSWEETFTVPDVGPGTYRITFNDDLIEEPVEVTFMVLGPLRITSLSMPTDVYVGSEITITVNVMDYFNAPVSEATVSGSVTMPEGAGTEYLSFKQVSPGVYTATYAVPDWEGSYTVKITASKPEAGGSTTVTGSFYASKKPPAPPDITDLTNKVAALTDNVNSLTSNVNKLASSVDKLTSDVSGVSSTVDSLSASVSGLTSDVSKLTSNVDALSSKVDSLSTSVSALSSGVSEASSKAEAAAATAANLTTLIYIAIIFSLLAFIFAIVSVVQLSRKIA